MSDQAGELNRDQRSEGSPGADTQTQGEAEISLDSMSKEQLLSYAEKAGVKVKPAMNKAEIIQAIADAQNNADSDGGEGSGPGADASPENKGPSMDKEDVETDNTPIGTIRSLNGVELVKIGPDEWIPAIRENISSRKPVVVISEKRAGKTIFAITGKPIAFDEAGRATVSAEDGFYLRNLPGYSLEEGND
jgi:hypothetical protein